jgi:hypothetical protein
MQSPGAIKHAKLLRLVNRFPRMNRVTKRLDVLYAERIAADNPSSLPILSASCGFRSPNRFIDMGGDGIVAK